MYQAVSSPVYNLRLAILLVTICTTTRTATMAVPTVPTRVDANVADNRQISNLQLYHRMPVLTPPDEPFSNIPPEAFTLDTNLDTKVDSKRTFKKDLSPYVVSMKDNLDGNLNNIDIGDLLTAFILLGKGDQMDESDQSDQSDESVDVVTRTVATVATVPANYGQNAQIKSIYSKQNQETKQLDKEIIDLITKELGTQYEPMTPFVNRNFNIKTKSHSNNAHYGSDEKHYYHYDLDKLYNGLDKHHESNKGGYGSSEKRYDSNKQHYYGSNKVHYDSNKQNNNDLKREKYDSDKIYYGLHKHHGTNKVHYGPHKHHDSNNGHLDVTKSGYESINEKYGSSKKQLYPRVKLAIPEAMSESDKKVPVNIGPVVEGGQSKWDVSVARADSVCRLFYSDPVEAAFCTGLLARDLAGAVGAAKAVGAGGRRGHSWLVLGEDRDQRLKQYVLKEDGRLPLVV